MLDTTIEQLKDRIKQSRLKEILSDELSSLLSEKPPGVSVDEFITAAAVLILKELKGELTSSQPGSANPFPSDIDCETIINGLLIGMRRDILESNLQMVKALGSAIAERDFGTSEHNLRVTIYAIHLAEQLDLGDNQIQALIKGSFLHDIGKIGLRDNTLLKKGQLSDDEFETVKKHVLLGTRIIQGVRWLEDAASVVQYHHERWDGSGYVEGLKGEAIPLVARIFTIADVFDALVSERTYKQALPIDEAIRAMHKDKGKRFDPNLLDAFLRISRDSYTEVVSMNRFGLEDTLLKAINRYFHFSATVDELRSSFGSKSEQQG
ncbi:MAG: HD-GYP domain-containing protein [Candidatus Zixiibacteriota bacterium]